VTDYQVYCNFRPRDTQINVIQRSEIDVKLRNDRFSAFQEGQICPFALSPPIAHKMVFGNVDSNDSRTPFETSLW